MTERSTLSEYDKGPLTVSASWVYTMATTNSISILWHLLLVISCPIRFSQMNLKWRGGPSMMEKIQDGQQSTRTIVGVPLPGSAVCNIVNVSNFLFH